ncbi:potassium transporter KtrB [Fusobacterium perfoetens]|uniref:TrkH family potassium uptake protein n=1 Tax=Fusobacterium perfoetens TaxID=852 RepID=UPI0015A3BA8B|nr:TrkH family potassium uptake protein [Fusobacterium perfoetens]MCF2625159.1 potassium transporter KtrB [Fusobacterium perfoetens]
MKFVFFRKLSLSRKLILGFMGAILMGTLLLMMPFSSSGEENLSFLTALFTITSAVCVTGLSVIDVGKELSTAGQIILLIFIQLGGLGIMTFSSFILLLVGKKITYEERELLKEERNLENNGGILWFLRKIFLTVVIIEGIGALFLGLRFAQDMPVKKAVYYGIFHSISAFCNAGFSLFSNNLEGYAGSFTIIMTTAYLIIIGGIGFTVIDSILLATRKRVTRFDLTSKVAILVSMILVVVGTVLFFILEYKNKGTIGDMSFSEKLLASFFQSVTTRTAGYNSVPFANLTEGSVFLFCILMFIGASPGSTGGGIKTTTFGVLIFYVISVVKKRESVVIFNRRIGWEVLNRAIAVLVLSIFYVGIITLIIVSIEDFTLEQAIFEVISAFATTGLSLGITADLGTISRILIICTMFLGRLGPMTFALALGGSNKVEKIQFPKENILVG